MHIIIIDKDYFEVCENISRGRLYLFYFLNIKNFSKTLDFFLSITYTIHCRKAKT